MQAVANSAKLLAGTVPLHKGYLLLHHHLPPSAYPSKHTTISPLLSSVQLRSSTWGIQANIAYFGPGDSKDSEPEFEPQREADATFFDYERRSTFRLPKLASTHVDAFSDIQAPMDIVLQLENATTDAQNHLLVCTHGLRDCRCGDTGGAVVAALRKAAPASLNVGEIAHVGGHKYAANVLAFPSGDWFGEIQPEHIDLILRYVEGGCSDMPRDLIPHWRGGRGLAKEDQISLAQRWLTERP